MDIQEKIKHQRHSFRDALLSEEGLAKLERLTEAEQNQLTLQK